MYQKFYIRQMKLELEAVQQIYLQKKLILAWLMVSCQQCGYFQSGCFWFLIYLTNIGHV